MEQNKQHGNGFGNGFLLGLLVGIVATLLLTTKKGREILHEVTEKGLDRFSDLESKLQETTVNAKRTMNAYDDIDEEEKGDDYLEQEPMPVKLSEEISEKKETSHAKERTHHEHEEPHKSHGGARRFFRKRAN